MFAEVFRFELSYRLRQPIFYLFLLLFFLLAFAAVSSDSVQVGGAVGNVARNAPFVIYNLLGTLSAIGLIVVTLFVTAAVNRDHETEIQELFFSTPLSKSAYLGGRFAGSIVPTVLAVMCGSLGIIVASRMPWQDPAHILTFSIWPHLQALVLFVLPNLFTAGALFFAVATLTRRVILSWVAVVVFFSLWGVALAFLGDLERAPAATLLDPFALISLRFVTKYWTVAERNTSLLPMGGLLLLNRLLWIAVGLGLLLFTHARYRMSLATARSRTLGRRPAPAPAAAPESAPAPAAAGLPVVDRRYDAAAQFRQWLHVTATEIAGILRGVPFLVITLMGVMNLTGSLLADTEGTHSYPLTRSMLQTIDGSFALFLLLVLIIYGGNLMWKERRAKLHEVVSALPVPNWIPLLAKLAALVAVATILLLVSMLTTVAYQLSRGYSTLELGLYLKGLFLVSLSEWILVAVVALGVHVLTNNMNLAFLLMVLYYLAGEILPELGVEHRLLFYAKTPTFTYSDMNGYGPYRGAMIWYKVYWAFLAVGLAFAWNLLWVRTTDSRLRFRLGEARRRLTARPGARRRPAVLGLALAGFLATGAWIFYNTNILNDFETKKQRNALAARYERDYKRYENSPQPRLKAVAVRADIDPAAPRVAVRGRLHAVNESAEPIRQLHFNVDKEVEIRSLGLPPHTVEVDDRAAGFRICTLEESLPPGAALDVDFDLIVRPRGFVNSGPNTRVVNNGVFFDNTQYIPRFGYDRDAELDQPNDRKRHQLPPRAPARPPGDPEGRRRMTFNRDADWIRYEATVSTSEEQTALAPGRLVRTWTADGRRYFQYRIDALMCNFYSFQSGRYAVARDRWRDVDIEIFYHPAHAFNIDRMVDAVKASLEYYTASYGPYQEKVIRIIEFPGYRRFAQSFPANIPYSESAHFINDLRNKKNLDMVFFITAHEVAHQWWGTQVMSADVQGAGMLIESLAQYSAYMVLEREYGREQMKKFLSYELDRYLRGRGDERIGEQPLCRVENQPYIYYSKGGLAFYALRETIGEDAMNEALRSYVRDKAYQEPPYTDTAELITYLRSVTPPEHQYVIGDLFADIILYDNRAETAAVERTADGKYRVKLVVQSRKYRAGEQGAEIELDHQDWIEIGVLGKDLGGATPRENYLVLERRRLHSGRNDIEIVVDQEPERAGIDPRNLLIDRVPGDNVKRVTG